MTTPNRQAMRDKALAAANRALALDPDLDEAYNCLGWIKFLADWDWDGAGIELRRALELNPNNADAHENYAELLDVLGREDEALVEIGRARKLAPVAAETIRSEALILFHCHRYDEALELERRAVALEPENLIADTLTPRLYIATGQIDRLISENAERQGHESRVWQIFTGCAYHQLGRTREAKAVLETLLKREGKPGANYIIAML